VEEVAEGVEDRTCVVLSGDVFSGVSTQRNGRNARNATDQTTQRPVSQATVYK